MTQTESNEFVMVDYAKNLCSLKGRKISSTHRAPEAVVAIVAQFLAEDLKQILSK